MIIYRMSVEKGAELNSLKTYLDFKNCRKQVGIQKFNQFPSRVIENSFFFNTLYLPALFWVEISNLSHTTVNFMNFLKMHCNMSGCKFRKRFPTQIYLRLRNPPNILIKLITCRHDKDKNLKLGAYKFGVVTVSNQCINFFFYLFHYGDTAITH